MWSYQGGRAFVFIEPRPYSNTNTAPSNYFVGEIKKEGKQKAFLL